MKVENLEIGKKIKLLREKFGVRQRELENELNIPTGTITQVENNKINIRLNYLKSIAEYFNVDYRWIMGIEREEEILNKNDKNFPYFLVLDIRLLLKFYPHIFQGTSLRCHP